MKKPFKILLYSILGIILLLFVLAMVVNFSGIPVYDNEAPDLSVEITEARITEGARITDEEAAAIWAYLQTVPLIHNPLDEK